MYLCVCLCVCVCMSVRVCEHACWGSGRVKQLGMGNCRNVNDNSIGCGVKEIILMYLMSDKCHRLYRFHLKQFLGLTAQIFLKCMPFFSCHFRSPRTRPHISHFEYCSRLQSGSQLPLSNPTSTWLLEYSPQTKLWP